MASFLFRVIIAFLNEEVDIMTEVKEAYLLVITFRDYEEYALFDSESKARNYIKKSLKNDKSIYKHCKIDSDRYAILDEFDEVIKIYEILPINVDKNFKIQ